MKNFRVPTGVESVSAIFCCSHIVLCATPAMGNTIAYNMDTCRLAHPQHSAFMNSKTEFYLLYGNLTMKVDSSVQSGICKM